MQNLVFYYPNGHENHFEVGHPERPERVEVIHHALDAEGWWNAYPVLKPLDLPIDFLKSVHSPGYLFELQKACLVGESLDSDTYTTLSSWQLALNAAGGAAAVASEVWTGEARSGFALTRPPGHHATKSHGMGFCLLNNIAIAAQYLLNGLAGPFPRARKLAIIDLDIHHGNGTQDIFWNRDDVFYISTHQWPLYPGTGWLDERGAGAGEGYTANFPLPIGTGDQGFRAVMQKLILPLLDRYHPEMLLVSIGFDVHWRDPLGSLNVSAAGLGRLIADLKGWADQHCAGKIALFLEGGYDLDAGQACSQAVTAALLGEEWIDPLGEAPLKASIEWQEIVLSAQRIWNLPN